MDDRRFDSLARSLAEGKSRRSVLKGLLGLGGAAMVGGTLVESDSEAARRPTPTPTPVRCPGNQIPNNGVCICPPAAPFKCGPACCTGEPDDPPSPTHTECCDNACCLGTCYGEELCCPTNPRSGERPPTHLICTSANGEDCCPFDNVCCGVDGCCDTVCWGGNEENDFCCSQDAYCPGNDSPDACCTNDFICCGAGTSGNLCRDPNVEGGCCTTADCPSGQTCENNLCVTPCTTEVRIMVEVHDGGPSQNCPQESSPLATEVGLYPYDGETGCGAIAIATANSTAEGPAVFPNVPAGLYCPLPTDPAIRDCINCPGFGDGFYIHVTADPCETSYLWAIGVASCCVEGETVAVLVHAGSGPNGCSEGTHLGGVPVGLYDCDSGELIYGPLISNDEGYSTFESVPLGTYCLRLPADSPYVECQRCQDNGLYRSRIEVTCGLTNYPLIGICRQGESCEDGTCVVDDPNAACQPGYVRSEGTCTPCAGGFASADGLTCERCGPGTYAPSGSPACLPCAPGYYTDDSENDECNHCPPGWHAPESGSGDCTECPLHTYSDENAAIECSPCAAGTYTEHVASTTCLECDCALGEMPLICGCASFCESGHAPDGFGMCAECAPGSASFDGNACVPCAAGSYAAGHGAIVCDQCAPGTYSDDIGAAVCDACPAGSFTSISGASGCSPCACGVTCNPATGNCGGTVGVGGACEDDSQCSSDVCGCGSPPGLPGCMCRFDTCFATGEDCSAAAGGLGAISCCEGDCTCFNGNIDCVCTGG